MHTLTYRIDRTITLGIAGPSLQMLAHLRKPRIPILMYHGIAPSSGNASPYLETHTSPRVFDQHMRHLRQQGYTAIDLATAWQSLQRETIPEKLVVITFDDGLLNFYTDAVSILLRYGHTATMFAASGFVNRHLHSSGGEDFMSWSQLREIHSHGITIGSHTVNHPRLRDMGCSEIECELAFSKDALEQGLATRVDSFSYPYAFPEPARDFVRRLRLSLVNAGYSYGVTTILGRSSRNSDSYFLPRLPINEHDDLRLFEAKLNGAYDWLHAPQLIHKILREYSGKSSPHKTFASSNDTNFAGRS
jgi:peptidoglycan/xylan/chitin deacetylase (PgdA/CDA1 family)